MRVLSRIRDSQELCGAQALGTAMGNALCPGTDWEQIVWVCWRNFIVKDVAWDCLSCCSPKHPPSAFNVSANKRYFYTALALSIFCTFPPETQTAFIQTNMLDSQGMIGKNQYQWDSKIKNLSSPNNAIIPITSEFPPYSSTLAGRQFNVAQPSTMLDENAEQTSATCHKVFLQLQLMGWLNQNRAADEHSDW